MSRQKLNQLKEQLQINDEKQGNLRVEAGELEEQIDKISRQIILEEKILAGTKWDVNLSFTGKDLYLEYHDSFDSPAAKQLAELCWNGWHSSYSLDNKYELHFDDTRVTIQFDNPEDISEFVRQYQIKLVNVSLPKALAQAKIDLETLEKLSKLV